MHRVEGGVEPFVDGVIGRRQRHRDEQAGDQPFGQHRVVDRCRAGHDHRKGYAWHNQHVLDPVIGAPDRDIVCKSRRWRRVMRGRDMKSSELTHVPHPGSDGVKDALEGQR